MIVRCARLGGLEAFPAGECVCVLRFVATSLIDGVVVYFWREKAQGVVAVSGRGDDKGCELGLLAANKVGTDDGFTFAATSWYFNLHL